MGEGLSGNISCSPAAGDGRWGWLPTVVAVRGEVSRISAGRLRNGLDPLARVGAVLQQENEQLLAQPRALNYRPGAETPYCPHKNFVSLIGLMWVFLAGAIRVP